MELLPQGQQNNTEVTWADQEKINLFSTLITKRDLLTFTQRQKEEEKEYLDDLSLDLELVDEDEKLNYKIGDIFVLMKQKVIMNRIEKDAKVLDEKLEDLKSQIDELDGKLGVLKKQLYAKFGNAINLER